MTQEIQVIRDYFKKLSLEPEVADLYVALHTYGAQSISELARRSRVERTRIYRLIETLTKANLIEVETHYKRSILKAAPIGNLQILLIKKEEELRALHDELELIKQTIEQHGRNKQTTQVQFYKGNEGLKQMFWNETTSTTNNISILYENMQNKTNSTFFERWVREFNNNKIQSRSIIGDHFLETQKAWYKRKNNERIALFESRYVPSNIFNITHSMVVYNDVVAYYNWREGNAFGIEIYNQAIADAQRSFFEMLWQQATPLSKKVSQQLPETA